MKYIKTFEKKIDLDIFALVRGGDTKGVLKYIQFGGDLNIRNQDGDTPLMIAAFNNKHRLIGEFINAGADINSENNDGETALTQCAMSPNIKTIEQLIKAGANWNTNISREISYKGKNRSTINRLNAPDFFTRLTPKYKEMIKELFPDEYAEYLIHKDANKYNL